MSDTSSPPKIAPAIPSRAPTQPAPLQNVAERAQPSPPLLLEPTSKKPRVVKAKRKYRRRKPHPHPAVAKNPNRPLEMKHQLAAVLAMTVELNKSELGVFSASAQMMQDLTRAGRHRVINALTKVYS